MSKVESRSNWSNLGRLSEVEGSRIPLSKSYQNDRYDSRTYQTPEQTCRDSAFAISSSAQAVSRKKRSLVVPLEAPGKLPAGETFGLLAVRLLG